MSLHWVGFTEFARMLHDMPEHLRDEAAGIVMGAARDAAEDARRHYPTESHTAYATGNLANGLRVMPSESSPYAFSAVVYNVAPHAEMYEYGTAARHTFRRFTANRGSMPPGRVFIPAAVRARAAMYDKLAGLLRRAGFTLSGGA